MSALTRRAVSSVVQVGSRLPAHATGMGRVLLAGLEDAAIEALYRDARLESYSGRTPTTPPALLKQARLDRASGTVTNVAGYEAGVTSIAAPIRDVSGRAVAAINISTVALLVTEAELRGPLAQEVTASAAAMSRALGHAPAEAEPRPRKAGG